MTIAFRCEFQTSCCDFATLFVLIAMTVSTNSHYTTTNNNMPSLVESVLEVVWKQPHHQLAMLLLCVTRILLGVMGLHFAAQRQIVAALVAWSLSIVLLLWMSLSSSLLEIQGQQQQQQQQQQHYEQLPLPPFWQQEQLLHHELSLQSSTHLPLTYLLHAVAAVLVNTTMWMAVAQDADYLPTMIMICITISMEWFTVTVSLLQLVSSTTDAVPPPPDDDDDDDNDDDNHKKRHANVLGILLRLCHVHRDTRIVQFLFAMVVYGWLALPLLLFYANHPPPQDEVLLEDDDESSSSLWQRTVVRWTCFTRTLGFVLELVQCHRYLQRIVWRDVHAVHQRNRRGVTSNNSDKDNKRD
jgi:hypothetical protein